MLRARREEIEAQLRACQVECAKLQAEISYYHEKKSRNSY